MTAEADYFREPNFEAIDEMVHLFGLYTLSVNLLRQVLPDLDLDLPDQRESARAQLQAATDDLGAKIASLGASESKTQIQRHVWRSENEPTSGTASIDDLMSWHRAFRADDWVIDVAKRAAQAA